jgi:hypothetical protein
MTDECRVMDCHKPVNRGHGSVQGWCPTHSARYYRVGDVRADIPIQDRSFPIPIEPLRKHLSDTGAPHRVLSKKHSTAYYRGKRRGGLSIWTADAIACALGKHPFEIWGPAWYELTDKKEPA